MPYMSYISKIRGWSLFMGGGRENPKIMGIQILPPPPTLETHAGHHYNFLQC